MGVNSPPRGFKGPTLATVCACAMYARKYAQDAFWMCRLEIVDDEDVLSFLVLLLTDSTLSKSSTIAETCGCLLHATHLFVCFNHMTNRSTHPGLDT